MKKIHMLFIITLMICFGGILFLFQTDVSVAPDRVSLNDSIMTAMQGGSQDEILECLTVSIKKEFESMDSERRSRDLKMQILIIVFMGIIASGGLSLYLYCQRSILEPFQKLQKFANDVAMGNLDIPLEMDRYGRFGAFTESFDLMREELKKARENERNADRSKKELVASLSHDIKTPVASIKATTELMLIRVKDDKEKMQLERIGAKADQINSLITDMFHATLEELQALSVEVNEVSSALIPEMIRNADYRGKVRYFEIPSCIILTDTIRLQQIFDNVIGNSYKYAGTEMEIKTVFEGQFLNIEIVDFGSGVSEDELPLLLNKFYRGKNAEDKNGYGLGLYISEYLLTHMSGELHCENNPCGFGVKIMLHLAG